MEHDVYGLAGIPAGDPGFTISIEIDALVDDLLDERRERLLTVVDEQNVRIEESPLGHVRLVSDLPHSGWWVSGQRAQHVLRRIADEFTVVGAEICRSDLWRSQPFFLHEPDGLGVLPEFNGDADFAKSCTVAIEVEAPDPSRGRPKNSDLLSIFRYTGGARLGRCKRGKRHIIVEQHSADVDLAASLTAKPLHFISGMWSISRVRVVVADVYRNEVEDRTRVDPAPPVLPKWQYASDDEADRVVVLTDHHWDHTGWTIDWTRPDGSGDSSSFVRSRMWRDENGIVNLRGVGRKVDVWTAEVTGAGLLDRFRTPQGITLAVDRWESTEAWLVESLIGQPVGLVIDLGPNDYDPELYEERDVINAQLHVLDDGVVMIRRSRTVLDTLRLADHSSDGVALDFWHHDDRFDDCTDGYLFSRDLRLVATACTAWFRDHGGVESFRTLGCSHSSVDTLPRSNVIEFD